MDGPQDGEEYSVEIGNSIKGASSTDAVQCSFRYDFQPASVDTTVCGLVTVASNTVVVEMAHSNAAGGIEFKGKITDNKEVECVLIFDPEKKTFVLEKLPLSCTQLRHVRKSTRAIPSKNKDF
ncbi:unnamed protein product [Aphanomyces euteiches]|uniref:Transcription elongation factor Eaf N-terminal domain-containing protein n=1 Tax=Aphanomyces euteiches TaxID=100861 RepID=A0A6G0W9R7_9STRA|nr:hypothetical protein Ae201684_017308 [Aphanomyces euteiches]KAH9081215.1 hypothetical protein Ae201684P_012187 [Aphanomyces euteiches]KAH9145131.1 hypothetical protein AeRB84_010946 [Aphanomyces euteiches]